jgi:hypothetical protein
MDRWNGYKKVNATIVSGGGFFSLKGVPQDSNPRRMTVWLHEERSSVSPYSAPDQRTMLNGVVRAVQIAQHVDGPIKVVWTREEDIQHDMYRPYWCDRMSACLVEKGMPVTWNNRFAGSSVMARWLPPALNNGLDPDTRKLCCVLSAPPVGTGRMKNAENV